MSAGVEPGFYMSEEVLAVLSLQLLHLVYKLKERMKTFYAFGYWTKKFGDSDISRCTINFILYHFTMGAIFSGAQILLLVLIVKHLFWLSFRCHLGCEGSNCIMPIQYKYLTCYDPKRSILNFSSNILGKVAGKGIRIDKGRYWRCHTFIFVLIVQLIYIWEPNQINSLEAKIPL